MLKTVCMTRILRAKAKIEMMNLNYILVFSIKSISARDRDVWLRNQRLFNVDYKKKKGVKIRFLEN
jgi:hypothetical protein